MINYKNDLKIDRYDLEEELIKQPQLYMEWSERLTEASMEKDRLKSQLEVLRAEIDHKVRLNPGRYEIMGERVTEGAIKAAVAKNKRVIKLTEKYHQAVRDERILTRAEVAFRHRKSVLSDLVQLNLQLHFAEPKTTRKFIEESDRHEKGRIKRDLKRSRKIKRRSL